MGSVEVTSFPRSGSTWLIECLRAAFPQEQVVTHGHVYRVIGRARNLIVPARNPLDSVSSWMQFTGNEDANALLDWYIRFYDAIYRGIRRVHIVEFDDLVSDPNGVMDWLAGVLRLAEPKVIDVGSLETFMAESLEDHVPSRDRQAVAAGLREQVELASNYKDSVDSFLRLNGRSDDEG